MEKKGNILREKKSYHERKSRCKHTWIEKSSQTFENQSEDENILETDEKLQEKTWNSPRNGVTRRLGHLRTPYGWGTLNLGLYTVEKKELKNLKRKMKERKQAGTMDIKMSIKYHWRHVLVVWTLHGSSYNMIEMKPR